MMFDYAWILELARTSMYSGSICNATREYYLTTNFWEQILIQKMVKNPLYSYKNEMKKTWF